MGKRIGRPPSQTETKTSAILFKIEPSVKKAWAWYAKECGVSLSRWITFACLDQQKRQGVKTTVDHVDPVVGVDTAKLPAPVVSECDSITEAVVFTRPACDVCARAGRDPECPECGIV